MVKKKVTQQRLTEEMRGKLQFTFKVIICLFLLLVGRMVYWNIKHGKEYSTNVMGQLTNNSADIPYERGKIYDRNGNMLAGNEKLYTLILEPKNILNSNKKLENDYITATAKIVSQYFGIDESDIIDTIEENPESYYEPIKTKVSYRDVEKYEKFMEYASKSKKDVKTEEEKIKITYARNVKGVTFEESYQRIYPYNTLACHLIGYTASGNVGNWGIEQYYNSTLNGVNGRSYSYFDEELVKEQTIKEAENGNSLVSTIDIRIQKIVEEKLKEYDDAIGSKETSILVMNPNNGEILAMANSDPFDLNDPANLEYLSMKYTDEEIKEFKQNDEIKKQREKEEEEKKKKGVEEATTEEEEELETTTYALNKVWRNPIVSDTNEPGSTYKPFTVSSGLESGVLTGKEYFECTGSYSVHNQKIGCSHVHGRISLKQSVAESCNVAMMNIAFKEKANLFYYYQNLFGFGLKTGIDLPGEANTSRLVYTADEKYAKDSTNIATNSFGQNFNCTMIQMASGFASLINGGYYYKPHVVKEIQNDNGDIVETKSKELLRKTISKSTSTKIKSYMKETVETGTGKKAQIAGYSIGGKTGTAEKRPRNKEDYYISFIGFTPVENPQLLIYVTIDEPNIKDQANASLAVYLERECMKEIVDIMGINPTEKVKKTTDDEDSDENVYYLDKYKDEKKEN